MALLKCVGSTIVPAAPGWAVVRFGEDIAPGYLPVLAWKFSEYVSTKEGDDRPPRTHSPLILTTEGQTELGPCDVLQEPDGKCEDMYGRRYATLAIARSAVAP